MEVHYQALCAISEFPEMAKCHDFLTSHGSKFNEHEPPYLTMARVAAVALEPQPSPESQVG